MAPKQDALNQGKSASQERIEEDRQEHKRERKKRSVPALKVVVRHVQDEETLHECTRKKGAAGDASLPSERAEPSCNV